MAVFRIVIFLLLFVTVASFAAYALTAQVRYKRFGLRVLAGTLAAAFVFFAILIVDQLA